MIELYGVGRMTIRLVCAIRQRTILSGGTCRRYVTRRTVTSGPFGEAFLDGLGALFDGSSVFCTSNLSVHSMGLDLPCSFWSCHVSPGVRCWPLATGEVLASSTAQGVVGCPILDPTKESVARCKIPAPICKMIV